MRPWLRQTTFRWQLPLVAADFVLLSGCVYGAVVARYWGDASKEMEFSQELGWRVPVVAAVVIVSMAALGMYQIHMRTSVMGRVTRQAVAFVLGWIALTVLYYVIPSMFIGRGVLGIALVLGYVVVGIGWFAFLGTVDADVFRRRVVILGAGKRAAEITRRMRRRTDRRGFKILGHIPIDGDPVAVPDTVLLQADPNMAEWAARMRVDEIVVGPDERRGTLPVDALLECKQRGVAVTELAEFFEREAGRIKIDVSNPSWLIFSDGFSASPSRRVIKRGFDVVSATLLMALAWPFMLLTALAIRIESGAGAPILYRQLRVGEYGKPFEVIKFRSMRTDAERDGVARWATSNDDRVTRVGRIIRKIRFDELPQLWNVLRGDMSVIGPRPERPQFVDDFKRNIRYYSLRHCVRPGLTGWAQLRYPYGSSLEDAEEKLKFDLFYVKNHNLVFDLVILVQTVEVVLFGRGAR